MFDRVLFVCLGVFYDMLCGLLLFVCVCPVCCFVLYVGLIFRGNLFACSLINVDCACFARCMFALFVFVCLLCRFLFVCWLCSLVLLMCVFVCLWQLCVMCVVI